MKDQMQEVYPVLVSYVDGEQPTANKLNGVLKQTKSSFDVITKAVGDPWDAQGHIFDLSPQKLSVPSLARIIGPSNYLGYAGNANEASTINVTLEANRNSWSLGFPLITSSSDINPTFAISDISAIAWGDGSGSHNVDITLTGTDIDLFTTEQTFKEDVVQRGDFFIDYFRGEIITYDSAENTISIEFSDIKLMGPGAPWSTNNVIPPWEETTNLCTVAYVSSGVYTLSLPLVKKAPRASSTASIGALVSYSIDSADQAHATFDSIYGEDTTYRLPYSIVATGGISPGDEIPEGFFLLWDNSLSRVVPSVTFQWDSDEYTLRLITSPGWLDATAGSPSTNRYRLICTGASLSESVGWLMASYRDNRHVGLNDGASIKNNLSFTNPISHRDLSDRFNGYVDESYTRREALLFRESSLPTNEHPQYLHRYGYASDDLSGNSANAMRGWLCFTSAVDYELGPYACNHNIYGILFGGGETSGLANDNNSMLGFFGGYDAGVRYPFGVPETGAQPIGGNPESGKHHLHGGLTYIPWYGAPLYLRGRNDSATDYSGAMIGFDLERQTEVNYIKLLPAYRDGSEDYPHMPADVAQSPSNSLVIMPALDDLSGQKRIAAEQIREWRFRGVSKVSTATNVDESVGKAARDDGDTDGTQFNTHFTSPGVVGADFVNVYSNAIFFSDTGDGKLNSFMVHGHDWINNGGNVEDFPTGIYYVPAKSLSSGDSATVVDSGGAKYLIISGDVTADYKAGEYIEFEYSSLATIQEPLRIESVTYELVVASTTYLEVDTSATASTSGTVYKKSNGYFALYNQNSDVSAGSGYISLSCGVNHGFAYIGTKFLSLVGYKLGGTDQLLSSYATTTLVGTDLDNTIIADATLDKHIGIYSYDGMLKIGTYNTYDEDEPNDNASNTVRIFTSAFDSSNSPEAGNIQIEAGLDIASPGGIGSNIYITAANHLQITSKAQNLLLKATTGIVNIQAPTTTNVILTDNTFTFTNTSATTGTLKTDNSFAITTDSGDLLLSATGGNIKVPGLADGDPEVSGALYKDASGFVKVSA